MQFIEDLWYTAAWSDDIARTPSARTPSARTPSARTPSARTIIGQHLVLFRKEDGSLVALDDTCPHRFAPMHRGRVIGDDIQCGYHGLRFDAQGQCSHNPHGNGAKPRAARLRSYPAVELDGLVWVWMGAGEPADITSIPRFPELSDADYAFTGAHMMEMSLAFDLIVDNLLDLSHAAYLHPGTLGTAEGTTDVCSVEKNGNRIQSNRLMPNAPPAQVFQATGAAGPDEMVDYWANMRWDPPGVFAMDAGIVAAGGAKEEGKILSSVQIVVPMDESRSYYFWKMFRNYNTASDELTQAIEAAVFEAFGNEDEPMIRAVQDRMSGREFWSMKPLLLQQDSAAVQARRVIEGLIEQERSTQREAAE